MLAGVNLHNSAVMYKELSSSPYFVDKTDILKLLVPLFSTNMKYICITRPRRFGKTSITQMLSAYLCKTDETGDIFKNLVVAKQPFYRDHLNKHNVVYMDLSRLPDNCDSYKEFNDILVGQLENDLRKQYPNIFNEDYSRTNKCSSIWDMFFAVNLEENESFIFIIDEWDAIFQTGFLKEDDKLKYLTFLKCLLKDQPYVEFAYMTGVLPIASATSGSSLNMFFEYNMAKSLRYNDYFGFTQTEVNMLFERYIALCQSNGVNQRITLEGMSKWYNGYTSEHGESIYNPRSIVGAFSSNELASYWTRTGPMDEVFYYVKNNVADVREDIVKLAAGETISVRMLEYAATQMRTESRGEIISAMVVYGFLTFDINDSFWKGSPWRVLRVPNYEIRLQFELALEKKEMGYVAKLALASEKMLEATLAGDTATMEAILTTAHDTETPSLRYNNEGDLAALVNLIYLAARDNYEPRREENVGAGRTDVIYYPYDHSAAGFIIELKVDDTPENSIQQIKDRRYAQRFYGDMSAYSEIMGRGGYSGKVLAVGMTYDKATKTHHCKVEYLKRSGSVV